MSNLTQKQFMSIYGDLLTTTNNGQGLSNVLQQLQDGFGNASPISISQIAVNFNRQGGNSFRLDNAALTAQVADINSMCQPNPVAAGTGALLIPRGTTAQRPDPGIDGMIRYNTELNDVETFVNGEWVS
jgi:hypothetical protein